jgi:hypothetical protein
VGQHKVEDSLKTFPCKIFDNNHVKLDQLVPVSWEGLKAPFLASTAPLLKLFAHRENLQQLMEQLRGLPASENLHGKELLDPLELCELG